LSEKEVKIRKVGGSYLVTVPKFLVEKAKWKRVVVYTEKDIIGMAIFPPLIFGDKLFKRKSWKGMKIRKIIKSGRNSYAVTLPKEKVEEFQWCGRKVKQRIVDPGVLVLYEA